MNHTKTYCKIDAETISCYRTNYQPEYWQSVANKVGNQCAAPVGAVLAVNALCDEVERLHKQRDELLAALSDLLRDMKLVDGAGQYGTVLCTAIKKAEWAIIRAKSTCGEHGKPAKTERSEGGAA